MDLETKCNSPKWKTPEEVMKFHRLKRKLSGRMTHKERDGSFMFSNNSTNSEESLMEFPVAKRRTPFAVRQPSTAVKKLDDSTDESGVEADLSSHSSEKSFFQMLDAPSKPRVTPSLTSFKNIIKQIESEQETYGAPAERCVKKIPIDWSLKSKIRFMSTKPFAWSGSMRTCEEVSAVTGFVRCLDPRKGTLGPGNLDTSSNAQFHQSCLYWQHPHLPWLPIFSRNTSKLSSNLIAAQLEIAESLQAEWTIAFKSLLQLVRTQQCPFFYIVGTQFQCLFRAAGIAGMPEINAIISPTTRGFRKMLEKEDIAFTMPLRKRTNNADLTCDLSQGLDNTDIVLDDDDDMEEWMDSAQVRKLTTAQKACDRKKGSQLDGSGDSLVMVKGMEVQGLFNLLVNCKNNMDRLPPTLISPTAFQLATLKSCQVRDAIVQVDGAQLYSVQIDGPIMPQALSQMCLLLSETKTEYSAAVATVKSTTAFTTVASVPQSDDSSHASAPSLFFLMENLSDCGLSKRVLARLCENDPSLFGVIDSIEPDHVI